MDKLRRQLIRQLKDGGIYNFISPFSSRAYVYANTKGKEAYANTKSEGRLRNCQLWEAFMKTTTEDDVPKTTEDTYKDFFYLIYANNAFYYWSIYNKDAPLSILSHPSIEIIKIVYSCYKLIIQALKYCKETVRVTRTKPELIRIIRAMKSRGDVAPEVISLFKELLKEYNAVMASENTNFYGL